MRIDSGHLRDQLNQLAGGAGDAARGQRTARETDRVLPESAYEPIDRLLLKRLSLAAAEDAAGSAINYADAAELAHRTETLMGTDPTLARAAHEGLLRRGLRDLLSS